MNINKTLLLLFLLAGLLCPGKAQDVTLVVTTNNGQEQAFHLSENGQMHFENGERLIIEDGAGVIATFQLADIRKLVCPEPMGMKESSEETLQLIPNPGHNHVIIKNLSGHCQGRIYTLDGRMVKAFEADEGMSLNISDLSEGMYLLNIDGQTLKLMKL